MSIGPCNSVHPPRTTSPRTQEVSVYSMASEVDEVFLVAHSSLTSKFIGGGDLLTLFRFTLFPLPCLVTGLARLAQDCIFPTAVRYIALISPECFMLGSVSKNPRSLH